ncbi:hypothetical protein H4S02_009958, partial [Coemansia sp. RSA 2611]
MMKHFAAIVFALGTLVSYVAAYTTIMRPTTQECYFERLKPGNHFSITFETAGKLPIDFS